MEKVPAQGNDPPQDARPPPQLSPADATQAPHAAPPPRQAEDKPFSGASRSTSMAPNEALQNLASRLRDCQQSPDLHLRLGLQNSLIETRMELSDLASLHQQLHGLLRGHSQELWLVMNRPVEGEGGNTLDRLARENVLVQFANAIEHALSSLPERDTPLSFWGDVSIPSEAPKQKSGGASSSVFTAEERQKAERLRNLQRRLDTLAPAAAGGFYDLWGSAAPPKQHETPEMKSLREEIAVLYGELFKKKKARREIDRIYSLMSAQPLTPTSTGTPSPPSTSPSEGEMKKEKR